MADETLPQTSGWQKARREYRVARFSPIITIRRGGQLAISADFVRQADISRCSRASLFLSADGRRLGLRFHSNQKDDDAFILSRDGGGKSGITRLLTATSLVRQSPTITALLREDRASRRFEPWRDHDGLWVIDLAPCFERSSTDVSGLERNVSGIYRYRLGSDTIYIGRGSIFDRASQSDRRTWQFDRIEFSILNDVAAEERWETYWLNEYRERTGRWPVQNKIGGLSQRMAG